MIFLDELRIVFASTLVLTLIHSSQTLPAVLRLTILTTGTAAGREFMCNESMGKYNHPADVDDPPITGHYRDICWAGARLSPDRCEAFQAIARENRLVDRRPVWSSGSSETSVVVFFRPRLQKPKESQRFGSRATRHGTWNVDVPLRSDGGPSVSQPHDSTCSVYCAPYCSV